MKNVYIVIILVIIGVALMGLPYLLRNNDDKTETIEIVKEENAEKEEQEKFRGVSESVNIVKEEKEEAQDKIAPDTTVKLEKEDIKEADKTKEETKENKERVKTEEIKIKPTVSINIKNFAYSKTPITISKGTTVTWTNDDGTGHTVTIDEDSEQIGLNSELLKKGSKYSFTFDKAGTFTYHCEPHPFIKGKIIVTDNID